MESSDNIYKAKGEIGVGKITKVKKSKGLGDTIEKFTTATVVKSLTQFMSRNGVFGKKGCGCDKRKKALNKAFPF